MDNIENTMGACKKRCENKCNWKRSKCNLIFNSKHYELQPFKKNYAICFVYLGNLVPKMLRIGCTRDFWKPLV